MPDYGAPVQFGLSVTPAADDVPAVVELTELAERSGLDLVAIQDHPYQPAFLETWTLITYLAARTGRIRFVPDVLNLQLRPPAMLAKSAATLDLLTDGRLELAVGAGGYAQMVEGMGMPGRAGGAAVTATAEALQILRQALDARAPVAFDGEYHQAPGYRPGPAPARRVPIWVGGLKPRMHRLTGRYADGFISPINTGLPPEAVPAAQRTIDEAALAAGRKPTDIRRLYNVLGAIGPYVRGPGLAGPVELWVETLTEWVLDLGFDSLIFWPAITGPEQVRVFAEEVVPGVRRSVAAARGRHE